MDKFVIRERDRKQEPANSIASKPSCSSSKIEIVDSSELELTDTHCQQNPDKENFASKKVLNKSTKKPLSFSRWQSLYKWLEFNSEGKAICKVCSEAVSKNLSSSLDSRAIRSVESFVTNGFNCWKNALDRFNKHETSSFHRKSFVALQNLQDKSIVEYISHAKAKEMADSRVALLKIFSTVSVLAQQGIAFRGNNNDEYSNLIKFLKMRAEDIPELKWWLSKPAGSYKWLHHDYVNEMLEMMAHAVINVYITEIKSAQYYAIIIDETSDISRLEQVSINFRITLPDFTIKEIFLGFYETSNTKSEMLLNIIRDVLLRYGLDITKLRGQCFDGAANMSGKCSGVQTLIRKMESRALFVHCTAHTLNLVAQDAMKNIEMINNFLGVAKDMITFIRDSPKRIAIFKDLQATWEENLPTLSPFCPTRWCIRVKSLKTLATNYEQMLLFFDEISTNKSEVSSKANGFLKHLESFEFYFCLIHSIQALEKIEILNTQLQKSDLNLYESHEKVKAILECLVEMRQSGFNTLWEKVTNGAKKLNLKEPKLPRTRRAPERFETADVHVFKSVNEYYQKNFNEIYDQLIFSLKERFNSETMTFLNICENFITGKVNDSTSIVEFYKDDFEEEKLKLHRDMFLDIVKQRKVVITTLKDVVKFLKENLPINELISEFSKLIRILLTIPTTSCTAERSFSTLRRLKTYLRSTMWQSRLNSIAILHVHRDVTENLDLDELANRFICTNAIRRSTFAIVNSNKK